jgi:hypothetical protein
MGQQRIDHYPDVDRHFPHWRRRSMYNHCNTGRLSSPSDTVVPSVASRNLGRPLFDGHGTGDCVSDVILIASLSAFDGRFGVDQFISAKGRRSALTDDSQSAKMHGWIDDS